MRNSTLFVVLLLMTGCAPVTMPNLPLAHVTEAFREGSVQPGVKVDGRTYKIPLEYNPSSTYPGWNLVAIPLGFAQESLKVNVPYEMYRFDGTTYLAGTEVSLSQGQAYWIKVSQPGHVLLTGKWTIAQGNISQRLAQGWNQIGTAMAAISLSAISIEYEDKIAPLPQAYQDGVIIPVFYYWDSTNGEWLFINGAKTLDKELLPGIGYFLYARKPITLIYHYEVPS
ncbi:hypothetical protein HY639_06175 [Candidatus Woesearchaeota archaeon]|nr:hypothetical protein [Candidatus Woesearchaeota archaeon]